MMQRGVCGTGAGSAHAGAGPALPMAVAAAAAHAAATCTVNTSRVPASVVPTVATPHAEYTARNVPVDCNACVAEAGRRARSASTALIRPTNRRPCFAVGLNLPE